MGDKYEFKDEKEAREGKIESSNLDRRKTKLKINDKLIGPKIKKIIETKNEYQDANDNKYIKTEQGDLLILYYSDAKKELDIMAIDNFQEGDYGLWLSRPAPYCLEQGQIIEYSSEEEDSKGAVLGLEENKYLQQEERIKNNFLWIYREDEIVFPEEKEEAKNDNQKQSGAQGESAVSSSSKEAKNSDNTLAANNSSNSNSGKQSEQNNNSSAGTTGGGSSGGGGQLYVCGGAELKCSCGDQTSNLQVVSGHNAKVCGNLIANVMDYKPMTNIIPFGNCQTTSNPQVAAATSANGGVLAPQPCVPNIPAPWAKVKADVKVSQQAALLEGSLLTCAYGGQIEIVDPGQSILKE